MDVTREPASTLGGHRLVAVVRQMATVKWALLLVVALSLALRLYGVSWDSGIPFTPHPDERAILMKVPEISPPTLGELGLLLDADRSPWNPRWFPYGSFPLYLLRTVQIVYTALPGAEMDDLRVAGRTISALADVATVVVVFFLAAAIYGRRVGLLASALVALAIIHIQLSHFYSVDTLLSMFSVAALYFMYRVAKEGRLRDSALAGVFIGLGLATKASQAPIFMALVMAHAIYAYGLMTSGASTRGSGILGGHLRTAGTGLAVGVGVSVLVFFIAQPYAFLDWSRFFADVSEQSEMVRRIRDYPYTRQYIDTTPYWYFARQLATWGLGWPLGIVAWASLFYASLRGMRLKYGVGYLAVGWALPMALFLLSSDVKVVVLASAVAFVALLATLPLRRHDTRMDVLLLSWVVPYLLIVGSFEVKFLRYMIPVTPLLLMFSARMLFAVWEGGSRLNPSLRPWMIGGLVALIGVTGFYALSYLTIYSKPHPAVRASQWIQQDAPLGAVILKEHWEEGLPNLYMFQHRELRMYEEDGPRKLQHMAEELAGADYLVFFSNRLYGTIPRLPERYPFSREYYRLLFTGELGYELVDFETSYPTLFGVSLVNDTFSRPDVPEPEQLRGFRPSAVVLNLGFADESFTVYDHPKVMVLRNEARLDAQALLTRFETAIYFGGTDRIDGQPIAVRARTVGLMLSPEDAATQQGGGTWTDIVRSGSWLSGAPVLAWLIVVEGISLLTVPIGFLIFRPLADRGYLFSKILGLLGVSLVVWLLASWHWMSFSVASINLTIGLLAVASAVAVFVRRREMLDFVRRRWRIILTAEAVFLVAFLAFVMLRMANPDLWHPFRGGEKPMDLAYLTAVVRSTYMPPYDPWLSGGYLNYYYWGQFMVATLIKATGIEPAVAYNLAVPLFFALTVAGAFAIVYNLAESTRRRLGGNGRSWTPVLAGLGGAVFVAVIGNMDGAVQVGQGVWRAVSQDLPFGTFDFWRSTRLMPPDPPGFEINEFPFFTFLFADLHAHMMALPVTLLAMGLSLTVVLAATSRRGRSDAGEGDASATTRPILWGAWRRLGDLPRLAVLGVVVGSLYAINSWDFPTYLAVAVAAVFIAGYLRHGGLSLMVLIDSTLKSALVAAVGYLVFLPFHLNNVTFFNSLESTTNETVLWQFLEVIGLFVFVIGSFFILESRHWLFAAVRYVRRSTTDTGAGSSDGAEAGQASSPVDTGRLVAVLGSLLLVGIVFAIVLPRFVGSTVPVLLLLLILVVAAAVRWLHGTRPDAPHLAFVAAIVGLSLVLAIGVDFLRLEADIERMNTFFKTYLQIWVMFGVAGAYLLWRMAYGRRAPWRKLGVAKGAWVAAAAILVVSSFVYPILGSRARIRDRFEVTPLTLNGLAFMEQAEHRDPSGNQLDLSADLVGIRWLQRNVEGSPVILEGASTVLYQWNGRISVYTGLPSVIGWQWHQEQQRFGYRVDIAQRLFEVGKIYGETNTRQAIELLRKYRVRYVYVGQFERMLYSPEGLRKFVDGLDGNVEAVYSHGDVVIYQVLPG